MRERRFHRAVPGGAAVFQRVYTRLGIAGRPPRFEVEWYPYANLVHTIRLREDTAFVRLSDLLQGAPQNALAATAALLLARLYRRNAAREDQEIYRRFADCGRTRRGLLRLRRARGRRVPSSAQGSAHDLESMFARLNQRYFAGGLRQPHLGWSARAWRRQLGFFDPGVDQIVLNRRLDHAKVPDYAVEYVLYHEMLHMKHPIRRASCGLQAHSPEFRREEKCFAEYRKARKILARRR